MVGFLWRLDNEDWEKRAAHLLDLVMDGLRELCAAGKLQAGLDPDALAVTLLASLQGGLLLAQVRRDTRPLETALDTILTVILT